MPERTDCKWMLKHRPDNIDKGSPCTICKGHVMIEGQEICPFLSGFKIYKPLIPLVSVEERQFSLQKQQEFDYPIDEDQKNIDTMLNLEELVRLRRLINFSVDSDEPDVVKIRDRITDMITPRKAWGRHKRIEIEKEDCN